jgi:serine phosphatase RsbU (regulator of sigma subunit)
MNHVDQRAFVRAMNRQFTEMSQAGRFATAVAMTYFSPTAELAICNAGHPLPLIFRRKTGHWSYLEGGGESGAEIENFPLGIEGDAAYEQFRLELERGDLIVFYTDSLVESVCRDGSLLGTERLLETMRTLSADEPSHLIHHLLAKLAVHGAVINDDVTMLVARCAGRSRGAGFGQRLAAQVKFLAQVVTFRKNTPWPELSWKNLGGALFGNKPAR